MLPRPLRSTLFPYTTLFRSDVRDSVAPAIGLDPDQVKVNVTLMGGGFGRRLEHDYAVEAALVSKAVNAPVKVVRSEEHTSELQSRGHLVCRLLLEKKNNKRKSRHRATRSRSRVIWLRIDVLIADRVATARLGTASQTLAISGGSSRTTAGHVAYRA